MLILLWRPLAIGGGVQTGNVRTRGDYHAPSYNWPAPKRPEDAQRPRRVGQAPVTWDVPQNEVVVRTVTPPPRYVPRMRPMVTRRRAVPRPALVMLPRLDVVGMPMTPVMDVSVLRTTVALDDPVLAMLVCMAVDD